MIPVLFLGLFIGYIVSVSFKDRIIPSAKNQISAQVQGDDSDRDEVESTTPHLDEFTRLIRSGHKPSQWLITEATSEAFSLGNWRLAKSISDNYPSKITIERRGATKKNSETVAPESDVQVEKEIDSPPQKLLDFNVSKTSSPIDGISDDEWQMFVHASIIEAPEFSSDKSIGMFRQNKRRLEKIGVEVENLKGPVEQYQAFEKEIVKLLEDGKELMHQNVAMPIDVDGETVPLSLSGLFAVMRNAGTANAAKWIDSREERKKFPHTVEAFKRCNGCF